MNIYDQNWVLKGTDNFGDLQRDRVGEGYDKLKQL